MHEKPISSGAIGSLYFAEIEVGQYLPAWSPLSDYRESYSARKERGGGAASDLSHEIDYMRYLFGDPVSWKIMKSKVSDLDINCEDVFKGLLSIFKRISMQCSCRLYPPQQEKGNPCRRERGNSRM